MFQSLLNTFYTYSFINSPKSWVLISLFSNQGSRARGGWVTWPKSPSAQIQVQIFLPLKPLVLASLLSCTLLRLSCTLLFLALLLSTLFSSRHFYLFPFSFPELLPRSQRESKDCLIGLHHCGSFSLPRHGFPTKRCPRHGHAPMPRSSGTEQPPPPGSD